MRTLEKAKDGGSESHVDAYFLIEKKNLFSIALLKFNPGGRGVFHTHAFNALTWFLKGNLVEEDVDGDIYVYKRKIFPKYTPKSKNHIVKSVGTSWCFTIRGPWDKTWKEHDPIMDKTTTLTHGRKIVKKEAKQ